MLTKITTRELAEKSIKLTSGETFDFFLSRDIEGAGKEILGITCVEAFEARHLLANCYGGGNPFIFDISVYDISLDEIVEAFTSYILEAENVEIKEETVYVYLDRKLQ